MSSNNKRGRKFAKRMERVPESFIREILAVTQRPEIISFAGGLPNPELFPVEAFRTAADKALSKHGKEILQYSSTEGLLQLREYIAVKYKEKEGMDVDPSEILITNGSQQALDLVGKVLVNNGDAVLVEDPTYLAALQSLALYGADFVPLVLRHDGPDVDEFERILHEHKPRVFYAIPNFQNPSGITWDKDVRERVAEVLNNSDTLFVEDDPYGEIRWSGERQGAMARYTDKAILLGSFSKTVAPGLRLGWIYTKDKELYRQLYIAKQASDLHTSTFNQAVLAEYLATGIGDAHIAEIAKAYGKQMQVMEHALSQYLPSVSYVRPDGGMFLWVRFDESVDTHELFKIAIEEGVAFVPGFAFYADQDNAPRNTARLNFTNASDDDIDTGVQRLARALEKYHAQS